jgi:hypothetical protein
VLKSTLPLELVRSRWSTASVKVVLGASLPTYFIFLFLNRELDFLRLVEIPLMFASVLLLISMVERIERQVDGEAKVFVRTYANQGEFYRELRNKVDQASDHVYTSYLRRYDNAFLGESAKSYFAECKAWAQRSDGHVFRRVITRSSLEHDRSWISQERKAEDAARRSGRHYTVRVLPWDLHDADALSIAIVDSEYIFVAFSGEEDKLTGFSLCSRRLAQDYFLPYYERIWSAGMPLATWNPKQPAPPAQRQAAPDPAAPNSHD